MLMSSLDENNKTSEEVQGLLTDGWCRKGGSLPLDLIIGLLLLSNSYFVFNPSFMVAKDVSKEVEL